MKVCNWADNALPSPKSHRLSNKTLNSRHTSHLLSLSGLFKRLPKHYRLLLLLLIISKGREVAKSILLKTPWTSDIGSRGPSSETDMNTSSLRNSFCGTRRHHESFQRLETTSPPSYNAHEPHQWPAWHKNPKCAQVTPVLCWEPIALSLDPLNKTEVMPGTGNISA